MKPIKKINTSTKEIIYIYAGIILIVVGWFFFPTYLFWRDSLAPEQTTQIVIPYQFDAMLKTETEVTDFVKTEEEQTELQVIGGQFGAFGDSYGSLNTLFSGLAFACLVASLYLQRKELQAQRLEIEDQKEEIKRGNEIADGQKTITDQQRLLIQQQLHDSKVQNFYSLLFKFLEEKHRKVEEMDSRITTGTLTGNTQFDKFIYYVDEYFAGFLDEIDLDDLEIKNEELKNIITNAVITANEYTKNVILDEEYVEYLCFILRFIESHNGLGITDDAIKIFISYQSFNEAYAMFLFAIFLNDLELQNFISKYALLRKLNTYHNENETFSNLVYYLFGDDAITP